MSLYGKNDRRLTEFHFFGASLATVTLYVEVQHWYNELTLSVYNKSNSCLFSHSADVRLAKNIPQPQHE